MCILCELSSCQVALNRPHCVGIMQKVLIQRNGVSCCLACFVPIQVANAIFMMPRDQRDSNPVVQAMLQGMCWCEKDRPADLASRNAYLRSQGKVRADAPQTSLAPWLLILTVHLCDPS